MIIDMLRKKRAIMILIASMSLNVIALRSATLTSSATVITQDHPEYLIINEIQVANIDMFIDPSYNYGGWIEFYNPTESAISLSGLVISDSSGNSFQLPNDFGNVPAYGYKVVWFDHYDTGNKFSSVAYKQVDFKLIYEGGTIELRDPDGNILCSQSYPQAIQRCSYARTSDGSDTWGWTSTPTPETSNDGSTFATTQLPSPVVDKDATVFTSGFTFNVTIPEGATLRYTTDCSTPTLDNGQTSTTGSFSVNGGTAVYRFRLYKDGYLPSAVVTRTYIYKDKEYYLPIISVTTADKNLNDNTIGAYVDGTNGISGNNKSSSNKNRSWERPVNFEYLVPDKESGTYVMAINQECDFEVCGGWSRHFSPAASFRLKGGKIYQGQNFFPYPVFDSKPYIKNKALMIRNGGNDNNGRIKDAAMQEVVMSSGINVDGQSTQPAHIFINGQYKFMFNIREPNNKNHGYSNFGIDTDDMDQFELNTTNGYEQKAGDDTVFRQWMSLAQQLADNPTDESIYEQICEIVDIDEYINYMAVGCYSGDKDWMNYSNNVKGYRSRQGGKFHLILMDTDQGFYYKNLIATLINNRSDSRYDTGKNFLIDIFYNMLEYEGFKKRFIDAFCLVDGSVFEPNRVNEIVTGMKDLAYNAMAFDGKASNLTSSANTAINNMSNSHAERINYMKNYFGLTSPYNLKFSSNIEDCILTVNEQEVPTGKFDGTLFAPITLTAKAPAGYQFNGWELDGSNFINNAETVFGTSDTWYYYDSGSLDNANWKSESYSQLSSWKSKQAPFGYGTVGMNGSRDYTTTVTNPSRRTTYYFRKTINLSEAPNENEIYQLTYYVNDGFVAYVNGTEIGRYNMPSGSTSYSQNASSTVGSTAATGTINIDISLLHAGNNVIAIEVHNASSSSWSSSSDIYWTAQLIRGTRVENFWVSTEESFDLSELPSTDATLTAVYEKLPDEQLLKSIATPIKINEVSAGNEIFINEYFKKNDWIELYNTTDTDLDVAGLYLSDDIDDPLKYQIPSGTIMNTIIPAHGHLIVWADKLEPVTQLHSNFKLDNSNGQMALLVSSSDFVNANADFFDAHPTLNDFADGLPYNMHKGDQSVGRYPDGNNDIFLMSRVTIEKPNSLLSYDIQTGVDEGIMGDTSFELDLAQGWNWISHPLSESIPVNEFKDFANRILSQTLEAYYSERSNKLEGPLKQLVSGKMYKMDITEDHTWTFEGKVPHSIPPTPLQPGWNWIGYPHAGTQTLSAALESSYIEDGDVIIGQSGFSVYSADDGWVGSLSSLTSGSGYMYKSMSAKALRFQRSATSVKLRKPLKQMRRSAPESSSSHSNEQESSRSCDRHAYPNVMAVIAKIQFDDEAISDEPMTIAAYADDECRGQGEYIDGVYFLTIYGKSNETLSFKAFGASNKIYDITEQLDFSADILGTRKEPIIFTLSTSTTTVPIVAGSDTPVKPIGFYNLSGLFASKDASSLRPGIYIVRYNNGLCKKFIIK